LWFATRGTGVVSLILLTAVVALGVAGATRWRSTRWPRFVVAGLHRNLSLLVLVFIAIHVITTVADGYAPISLLNAVLPFTSAYRPVWLGLGAVALDLLLALTVTSLLRRRIGYRPWRALHWLAYASWPIALMHGLGTGTDARVGWMQLVTAGCVACVVAAVLWRVGSQRTPHGIRAASAVAAFALPLAIGGWYLSGPGQRGWASRAGTPVSLLPHTAALQPAVATTPPALPVGAFRGTFSGRVHESGQDQNGRVLVDISGRTQGARSGMLWIRLQGEPSTDGGVEMTASGASFGPTRFPNAYVGKIVGLQGNQILLSLDGQSRSVSMLIDLRLNQSTGTATGTVSGQTTSAQ
jgi:hypothetical protein